MIYEFILPDIGEGISEARLINWSVKAGDRIKEGEEVATISTDKVDVELPSPRSGTIAELCWEPGDTIKVGSVFLRIETRGEPAADKTAGPATTAKAKAKPKAKEKPRRPGPSATGQILAAPSTRKYARELGVALSDVSGSGPRGRILRGDVEAAAQSRGGAARGEAADGVGLAMAERMSQSVHVLAHSTINFEARADGFCTLLDKLAPKAEARGLRLSPTALFAKCAAAALSEHPRLNATIDEDQCRLVLHKDVNLGIALASERGLLVPVVRRVNRISLFALAEQLAAAIGRGRDGALRPGDMRGGTFTLSNTGGLERATITSTRPIINAPQAAILWVSRITDQVRVDNGAPGVGAMVSCSLSFDHRFIDGAGALAFVNDMADHIESPGQALAAD